MHLTAYLNFPGTCAEAFKYYEQHLGGTVTFVTTHADLPGTSPLPPAWRDKVLHATIALGGTELAGADIPGAEPMRSAYLTLDADSDADAERIYAALADGGSVLMKMEPTFFASRFGQVRDRFGINWMILHRRPAGGGPAAADR